LNMKPLFFAIAVASLLACNNQETSVRTNGYEPVLKDRQDSVEHDVLEGHDQAMARFAKLSKNTRRVQQIIDSLTKNAGLASNNPQIAALSEAKKELEEATFFMNEWMDGFKLDSLRENKEARIKYLESELIKVNVMKQKIITALSKSDSLLDKQ